MEYYYKRYFDKMYHSWMIHLLKYWNISLDNWELNVFLSMMDKHFDYLCLFNYYNYSNCIFDYHFLEEHIFGFYLFVYLIVVFYLELFAVDLLFRR